MVLVLGLGWRQKCRDSTQAAWKAECKHAIGELCKHWSLPGYPDPLQKLPGTIVKLSRLPLKRGGKKRAKTTAIAPPPKKATLPTEEEWAIYFSVQSVLEGRTSENPALQLSVDSQCLAGWLNGETRFTLGHLMDEIMGKIIEILLQIRVGREVLSDKLWLSWQYRRYNVEADFCANLWIIAVILHGSKMGLNTIQIIHMAFGQMVGYETMVLLGDIV